MPLLDCLVNIGAPKPMQDFILAKKDAHIKNGLEESAAEKQAIQDFKNETVQNLVDLHSQIGNDIQGIENKPPEPPIGNAGIEGNDEPATTGIRHATQENRATELKIDQPERGQGVSADEAIQNGRDLLSKGADPDKIAADFKADKGKNISYDNLSIVRARHEQLVKATNAAIDKYGENSKEAKAALSEETNWYKDVVKPMQTEWSKIGMAQQGETEIDTGSFIGMTRAVMQETGKELSESQKKQAAELVNKVKALEAALAETEKKTKEALDKNISDAKKPGNIKDSAKKIARIIRKGKIQRPGSFNLATPGSIVWDVALEIAAKTVENLGTIAEAVSAALNHVKGSEWYKNLTGEKQKEAEKSVADYFDKMHEGKGKDLSVRFADKKDNKFEPQDAKDIWGYAKENYIDKGSSYADMLRGTATDLGLTTEQVRHAISQPKSVRNVTNAMYKAMYERQKAMNAAKVWVKKQGQSKIVRFLQALPNAFFRLKVFGHGTVGGVTHAGMNLFQPSKWKVYFPFFIKQFKYAFGSTAEYAKAMEDLKNHHDFVFWKQAGLAVDPKEVYDDYQALKPWFGSLGERGDRGFNALKVYRLDLAKSFYDGLSNVEKADPETPKEIAKLVNHSTGTTEVKVGRAAGIVLFAPKLEVSRWQRLITDPAKAAITFSKWADATPSEKVAAKIVARSSGEKIATYAACLLANSAILSLVGSGQKINVSDPTKSDWLKFKAGGKAVDVSGGMESTLRFVGSLLETGWTAWLGSKQDFKALHGDKPQEKDYKDIMAQIRFKMSPFMSTIMDISTGTDAMDRPLPFSHVPPKKGVEPYGLGFDRNNYLLQQLPIPIVEGIKEVSNSMKEKGMSEAQVNDYLAGILYGAIAGGTGAKVADEPKDHGIAGGGGGATGSQFEFKPQSVPTYKDPKFK